MLKHLNKLTNAINSILGATSPYKCTSNSK